MEKSGRYIQSVERALGLLEFIRSLGGRARLVDLTEATGLSKSTVHGMLDTLVTLGYVTREGTGYTLGLRLRLLAQPVETLEARLRGTFAPALQAFSELCQQNCLLAVPSGTRAYLTLDGLDGLRRPLMQSPDERRDALTTSAVGKIFLTHDRALARRLRRAGQLPGALEDELRQVDNQGFALDLQASEQGLNCVALPLRMRGQVVAALSASGPAKHFTRPTMRRLASSAMRELFDLIKC